MPSHCYFYASNSVPAWDAPDWVPVGDVGHAVASALVTAFPGGTVRERLSHDGAINVHVGILDVDVAHDHLHIRIPYWASHALREHGLRGQLHTVARIAQDIAGWEFFDHGDQGLGERGEIDRVEAIVGGIGDGMRALLEEVTGEAPEPAPVVCSTTGMLAVAT